MKKLFKLCFVLSLGAAALVGCGEQDNTVDYSDPSLTCYFHFYIKKGEQEIEVGEYDTKDIIKLTKDQFVDRYLDGSLEGRYPYYSYINMTYTTGTEFAFDYETTNKYLNDTPCDYSFGFLWSGSGWNVYLNYVATSYNITYVGYEDHFTDKNHYSIENQFELPQITEETHRKFVGWKIQGTEVMLSSTPNTDLRNLVLEPVFENNTYKISYTCPIEVSNDNPTTFTYYDDTLPLTNLKDDPNGAYTFDGFYLDNKKITSIDPRVGKDITIECRFNFTEYTAKYFVDDELVETKTFTMLTLKDYVEPEVPNKDHYNGAWSAKVEKTQNYEINAVYTEKKDEYKITYEGVKGADNPNPTAYSFFDDVIELKPLESNEKITFNGWKIDGKTVTSFNPKDYLKDITIVADIEVKEYTITYYVGEEIIKTDKITFETLANYSMPNVPSKEHYVGKWDLKVDSLKDYTVRAIYELEKFTVKVVTNIEGYSVDDINVEYGSTYQDVIDQIEYDDKFISAVYSDEALTTSVTLSSLIDKNITIYLKWETLVKISSLEDWSKIVNNPSSNFVLTSDISFKGGDIPVVSNFTGVLDGNGHKITRFAVSNTNCAATYGLFIVNSGTIKNLIIEDGTFVAKNADGSSTASIGLLCGNNKGTIENVDFNTVTANITTSFWIRIDDFQNHTGYLYSGLLCGNNQGTIKNCFVDSETKATFKTRLGYSRTSGTSSTKYVFDGYTYHGLIAGLNTGKVENITCDGQIVLDSITLDENAPGTWDVSMKGGCKYHPRVGGLVGRNREQGVVSKSISSASISLKYGVPATRYDNPYESANVVGGVVGISESEINSCQATSTASIIIYANGNTELGGIAGRMEANSVLKACYSECRFSISNSSGSIYIGGISGRNHGAISYCHASLIYVTIVSTSNRSQAVGGLVGDTTDTSSIMLSVAYVNLVSNITCINCYALGYVSASAMLNKITVYAPTQSTTILTNENITSVESMDDLYQKVEDYHFDELDFTLYDDKLPTIEGIGKIVEEDNSQQQNNND